MMYEGGVSYLVFRILVHCVFVINGILYNQVPLAIKLFFIRLYKCIKSNGEFSIAKLYEMFHGGSFYSYEIFL